LEICGTTNPTFFKAIKILEDYKFIEIDRTLKRHNKYKINKPGNVVIPHEFIDQNKEIFEIYQDIVKTLAIFGIDWNKKFDVKITNQIDNLKLKVPINRYFRWFLKHKIKTKKIKRFNFGIFSCEPMVKEYLDSFEHQKHLKRSKVRKRKLSFFEGSENLKKELLIEIVNIKKIEGGITKDESELLKEAVRNGEVFFNGKEFILLFGYEKVNFICREKGKVDNSNCLKCFEDGMNNRYINKVDCQIVNIFFKERLERILKKKNRTQEEIAYLEYLEKINILKNNKLRKNIINKIRKNYKGG
jgi:hypothetical protein